MKALPCPSCSAPIPLQRGIALQKCSFCDTEVKPDFEAAPEFEGLEERQFDKLLRRATDSEERGFIAKAELQFRSLAALLEGDNDEREVDIQVQSYRLRIKSFLHTYYNDNNGETLLSFQHESKYADVSDPNYTYMRIDAPMIDLIDDIEDHCERLSGELRNKLATECFKSLYNQLVDYLIPATKWIAEEASSGSRTVYGDYSDWEEYFPLEVPVYMSMQIKCEMYSMLIRYTEIIDLGEETEEILLKIYDSYRKNLLPSFTLGRPHPRHRKYSLKDCQGDRTVQEFYEYKAKLEERIAPALEEIERIKREKEAAARAEEERIRAEKARKHQEWINSPEYKKMRAMQIKVVVGIGVAALLAIILNLAFGSKQSNNNQSTSLVPSHSSLLSNA